MPRKQVEEGSMSGYWRTLFRAEPNLLKLKNNSILRDRWEHDHPGEEFDKRQSQALANVKSLMRKKKGRKGARMAEALEAGAPQPMVVAATPAALERLETSIDHVLAKARDLDPNGLEKAIKHLRAARNEVVWKSGKP